MAWSRAQIKRRIAQLEDFEGKYRAYLAEAERHPDGKNWTTIDMEARKRELLELAPAVDQSMRLSGVGVPALAHPAAIGGGLMANDMPSLIFYHGAVGLDESGFAMQRKILEMIPAAIGGLKTKLEEAPDMGLVDWDGEMRAAGAPEPHLEAGERRPTQSSKTRHRLPTLIGKLSVVPPLVGFIADLSVAAVAVAAVVLFLVHFLF